MHQSSGHSYYDLMRLICVHNYCCRYECLPACVGLCEPVPNAYCQCLYLDIDGTQHCVQAQSTKERRTPALCGRRRPR